MGMYGPRYVWMLVGWYKERWWEVEDTRCTVDQLTQATEGYFAVDTLNSIIGNKRAVSGLVRASRKVNFSFGLRFKNSHECLSKMDTKVVKQTGAVFLRFAKEPGKK